MQSAGAKRTALGPAAELDSVSEDVDDFAFAFVTPLGAENDGSHVAGGKESCGRIKRESPFF